MESKATPSPGSTGAHTSHAPHGPRELLAEVRGNLLVPADSGFRERDDAVGARLGDELRAIEQRLDAFPRIGRRGSELDPHASALVEAPAQKPSLLEHSDEHARVTVWHQRCEGVGIDEPTSVAQPSVDGTKLGGCGHVGDGEAPERGCVRRAREKKRLARLAVTPRAADHLHVALHRVRVVDEADEAHVSLVDPHAECRRRDDGLRPACDEVVLDTSPLLGLEAGVVMLGAEPWPRNTRASSSVERRERA